MKSQKGKVAVVTGASRGVGRHIAARLGLEGATVALLARNQADLEAVHRELASSGAESLVAPVDLSKPESLNQVKRSIEESLGTPSVLVNAAGVFGPIDLVQDSDPAKWIETIMINSIAPYLTCRAFVGAMIEGGWGRIVNVTSAAALHEPGPMNSAYATSKVALNQFTRHLAAELKGTGVTANVIHPGDLKTDMWADIKENAERLGTAAEAYVQWANWVEKTGWDDPGKAADLVFAFMGDDAAGISGRFLWIKDGLQSPIPSWGESSETRPWRQ